MLQIVVSGHEMWDERLEEFVSAKPQTLQLEHSLVSISKWEQKWHKPFLTRIEKTPEEITDYIRCMTITQNVDSNVYRRLSADNFKQIQEYIDDTATATTFGNDPNETGNGRPITAEIIYYWMICFGIPFECQKWHLNRLLTLIKVCERKARKSPKMGKNAIRRRNADLNAARRKRLNSKG